MKLVVTIDTEEDNWGVYRPTGWTLRNIERIPALQDLFNEFNVKPTYLITYPVAMDRSSVSILKPLADQDRCEIGSHCHPWNTPPFEEETNAFNSMLCNLPSELQYKKIGTLHDSIVQNFGRIPVSFRSGRWGYNRSVAKTLMRLNYRIDTSVTAYTDWTTYNGPDFSNIGPAAYATDIGEPTRNYPNGYLAELPATVGYLQQSFEACNISSKIFSRQPWRRLKVNALLRHVNLLNKISLSPELSNAEDMIRLTKTMIRKKYHLINMFFHSTSLMAGLDPFVKTKEEEIIFLGRIKQFLCFLKDSGIESVKLAEAFPYIKTDNQPGTEMGAPVISVP